MSASREKQNRQAQANSGWVDPKVAREAEQRVKEKRSTILYAVIGIIFVVAIAATMIWRSNIIQKNAPALTVDGETYTAAELSYYYKSNYILLLNNASYYISYLGLNTSAPLETQTISDTGAMMLGMMGFESAEAGTTWHDYFLTLAKKQLVQVKRGLEAAEAEGFVYSDGLMVEYEAAMQDLRDTAAAAGASVDDYLSSSFGSNITEKIYGEHLLASFKFNEYCNSYVDSLTFSDSEIEAVYKENPDYYDKVSYIAVKVDGNAESTTDANGNKVDPTEEESAAAREAAKAVADAMLADYQAGKSLSSLADASAANTTFTDYTDGAAYIAGDSVSEWLFDEDRKDGDSTVITSGASYYVVVYNNRFREEYNTIDVRHILIMPEAGTKTSSDEGYEEEKAQLLADAKAIADDLLAQWKSGEATEESFAALALEHSEDSSKYDGGLYPRVYQGQMVAEFEDWCFDPDRKVGDTDIVETVYGYHIMYFSGTNVPYWQVDILSALENEDYLTWVSQFSTGSTVTENSFGMKFVG